MILIDICFVFFFSSRRRHTRLQGDWSSDVCSSDLLGISGADLARQLLDTEPRIATPGGRDRGDEASISITPYQMASGEETIVAEKIYAALAKAPRQTTVARIVAPATDVTGQWDVQI